MTAILATVLLVTVAAAVVIRLARSPSNERNWALDQAREPDIAVTGEQVRIGGVRDFRYPAGRPPEVHYREETVEWADVQRMWFALAPFATRFRGLAHAFVSFELAGDRFLVISIEARREAGEGYSMLDGLLGGFELTYVIGTEEDVIGLRAIRGDTLYLYPSAATPEQSQAILKDMLQRARETQARPEFYNTVINNCNTNLRDHVNRVTNAAIPWGWGILLPGYSDGLVLGEGLLDTDLPLDAARLRFRVDDRAREALTRGVENFGRYLRDGA